MEKSILIQSVSIEEFSETLRTLIREELSLLTPKESTSKFLTRQEAANLLKISLPTLNEYTRSGIIKGSRIGTRVLYAEADVDEAVKAIPTLKYRR